jgi:hypothetical protein
MIAAIKYLRWDIDNSNRWRINSNYIFVGGASSGSITALMTAYFNEDDESDMADWMKPILKQNGGFEGDSNLDFTDGYSYEVSGVSNMLGATVDLDFIDEGEPMIVGIHGTEDDVVPYGDGFIKILEFPVFRLYGSSLVHQRALDENIKSTFISVEDGGHGDFLKDENLPWLDSMINTTLIEFYNNVLCPEPVLVNDIGDQLEISISPNPANNYIEIFGMKFDENKNISAKIYSIFGDLIVTKSLGFYINKIDVSKFENGAYFIKISDDSGRNYLPKVFIIK